MGLLSISNVFKKPVLTYTFTFILTCSVVGTISLLLPICSIIIIVIIIIIIIVIIIVNIFKFDNVDFKRKT